jgi:hypothetical protein
MNAMNATVVDIKQILKVVCITISKEKIYV